MKSPIELTDTYQAVVATSYLVCFTNVRAEVYIGPSLTAPAPSVKGFPIKEGSIPHAFQNIDALGGQVWVKGKGVFYYASDA